MRLKKKKKTCRKVLCHQKYFIPVVSLERQRERVRGGAEDLISSSVLLQSLGARRLKQRRPGLCPSPRGQSGTGKGATEGPLGASLHRAEPAWRQTWKELPGPSSPAGAPASSAGPPQPPPFTHPSASPHLMSAVRCNSPHKPSALREHPHPNYACFILQGVCGHSNISN